MGWMLHHGKRLLRIVVGLLCLIVGLIMAIPFVPGPGLVFVFLGLGLLAVDFVWAAKLHGRLKSTAKTVWDKARGASRAKK